MANTKKEQSIIEEWFNTISHGLTAISSIVGLVVLIIMSSNASSPFYLFSALFYGISLVILYSASTLYHGIQKEKLKQFFNVIDHMSIYLLIAGTYTPILLLVLGGTLGWGLFAIQWGLALFGIVFKAFYTNRFEAFSVIMYALMGWMIVFKINSIASAMPTPAFWLLVAGGLSYTLGIIFYVIDHRMRFSHFIWHLFVMTGSILHFLMMVMYVF